MVEESSCEGEGLSDVVGGGEPPDVLGGEASGGEVLAGGEEGGAEAVVVGGDDEDVGETMFFYDFGGVGEVFGGIYGAIFEKYLSFVYAGVYEVLLHSVGFGDALYFAVTAGDYNWGVWVFF